MKNTASKLWFIMLLFLIGILGCGPGNEKNTESAEPNVTDSQEALGAQESTPELVAKILDAALEGDLNGVKMALESGAAVNGTDAEGHTPLMFAAFNGHSGIVLHLLDAGASIDRRDLMGRTSLLYAATGPFPETVKILLDKGAKPNVVDSDEHFTPLMHAAAEGNLDVVKILVKGGSDPDLKDVDGDNAASFARQAGHIEVADYLDAL